MRPEAILVFLAGLGLLLPATACSDGSNADVEIDRTLQEWAQAFARGDSKALVDLVTEDAEFWTHGAPPITGRPALAAAFDESFAEYSAAQRFVEVERQVLGDRAMIRGLEINTLKPKAGGETTEYRQRAFSFLRREANGRWLFARGMTNEGPLDFDTDEPQLSDPAP